MAGDDDAPGAVVPARELRCPNCGAPAALRGFLTTQSFACPHCGAVIDTTVEPWRTVQAVEGAYKTKPVYALGTRGTLDGAKWEVIGWCERSVRYAGQRFAWEEHLLYNPYEGFRYLIYQDGHFCVASPIPGLPASGGSSAAYEGQSFKHFTTGKPAVDQVLGEFPWQVKRGDVVEGADYVDPPHLLSSEKSEGEVVWSRGRYLERAEVEAAFGKPTRAIPWPTGVHMAQPNPFRATLAWMGTAFLAGLVLWSITTFLYLSTRANRLVWEGSVSPEGLTQEITLERGRTLQLSAHAPLDNAWCFLPAVVVGPLETEQARYLGLEVSYYHGVDGGESWSEGGQENSETIAGVPPGRYLLQLSVDPQSTYKGPVTVRAWEDVSLWRFPCCSCLLLCLVPLMVIVRRQGFESRRWAESDHAS